MLMKELKCDFEIGIRYELLVEMRWEPQAFVYMVFSECRLGGTPHPGKTQRL